MGFGFREADRFPLAMIRRFDLRPRLVVVNADGFFGGGLSPWAEVVNRDTPFAARKLQWEAEAAHEVRRRRPPAGARTGSELFGLPGLGLRARASSPTARAATAPGSCLAVAEGTAGLRRSASSTARSSGAAKSPAARAFKAELDARGARLVLTRVPSPEPMPGAGPARFAELLGVPLVAGRRARA